MDTHLTTSPDEAAQYVREGRLAAFPTETVYGLGADAFQPSAVQSIFTAKGRPADNPLIVHLVARAQLRQVAAAVPPVAETLLNRFAPGPLTLILPRAEAVPGVVTAGLGTVGVRFPVHDGARAFLRACDTPVAAPSANRSGRPSPTHWTAVQEDLGGRIACILKGGRTEAGVESTVLDCTASPPTVLRPGAVSVEQLRDAVGVVDVADASETDAARSPGTKHRHYAPAASVRLVQSPAAAEPGETFQYLNDNYNILGLLIEEVTGTSYGAHMEEAVFGPLGMHDTTAKVSTIREQEIKGHSQIFGINAPRRQSVPRYDVPSGYIVSNLRDMRAYLEFLIDPDEEVLTRSNEAGKHAAVKFP